ncbi:MAG TPA: zinc transporter ZntB [Gammaproteobacteria bacterium]|jgi:zinc transporter|nr:zinc transporter ZntB [Gammaproteobacteria bacterium]
MNDHVLLAYTFVNGKSESLIGDAIAEQIKSTDNLAWVHMDANHRDTKEWLDKEAQYLDPFIIEALLADETRPRMVQVGDGVLLILRGVNLNKDSDPEDMVSIRLWVDQYRIISLRRRKLKAIWDIDEKIKTGKTPKDAGHFVCMLVSRLFERMEPVLSELDELTDDVEEQVLESADTSLRESIVNVRKQAIMYRRYMAPQRDAIGQLRMSDAAWLEDTHKRQLQESHNHVTRYVEDLDAIRERAQIVKDELANILSDRLNKNMYVLSVVAAIFLPLGFLTGLLGINLGGIPGADNGSAFWLFCGILVTVVAVQVFIFKKFKWF